MNDLLIVLSHIQVRVNKPCGTILLVSPGLTWALSWATVLITVMFLHSLLAPALLLHSLINFFIADWDKSSLALLPWLTVCVCVIMYMFMGGKELSENKDHKSKEKKQSSFLNIAEVKFMSFMWTFHWFLGGRGGGRGTLTAYQSID